MPGGGGKKRLEEDERRITFSEDEPAEFHNESTQGEKSLDEPWQRDSYNLYIARSSVFSNSTDRSSQLPESDVAQDLQTVTFNRIVRSAHGPAAGQNGGFDITAFCTRL